MSIFDDNPVLRREWFGRLRIRRLNPWGRFVAALLLIVVVRCYAGGLNAALNSDDWEISNIWPTVAELMLSVAVILGPTLTASSISAEREKQTWEGLTLTRLTAAQVYAGKWLGRQAPALVTFVTLLPLMVVCGLARGCSVIAIAGVWLFVVLNNAFFAAIGLFCSACSKKTITATVWALVAPLVLCVGLQLAGSIGGQLFGYTTGPGGSDIMAFVDWMNPYAGLDALLRSTDTTLNSSYDSLYGWMPVQVCVVVEIWAICSILFWLTGRFRSPGGLNRADAGPASTKIARFR